MIVGPIMELMHVCLAALKMLAEVISTALYAYFPLHPVQRDGDGVSISSHVFACRIPHLGVTYILLKCDSKANNSVYAFKG